MSRPTTADELLQAAEAVLREDHFEERFHVLRVDSSGRGLAERTMRLPAEV